MNENSSASEGQNGNEKKMSFLDELAAKMAAGPPKKPVGLLKKSNVAEAAELAAKEVKDTVSSSVSTDEAEKRAQAEAQARASLADILKQTASQLKGEGAEADAEAVDDKTSS